MEWFVAVTRPRHEFAVQRQLSLYGIENFLPTHESRSWADKKIVSPLFPRYLFTGILNPFEFRRVLGCFGICGFINFQKHPAAVAAEEIEALRAAVNMAAEPEEIAHFCEGDKVRVREGSLAGTVGMVERRKSHCRLIFRPISCIASALSVEIDEAMLEKM